MIPWLDGDAPFPDIAGALKDPNGLLCAGGDLSPQRLLGGYRRGIFPWFSDGDPILWWSPDPRMVLFPAELHVSHSLGRRLRYGSCLPENLKELAICQVARSFSQQFEWSVHVREAEKAGVAPAILAAVADGRRPEGMTDEEALIHDSVAELIATRRWSDVTYGRIVARYGEQGAVEIPAMIGIYTLLAYVLNVGRTPSDGPEPLTRWPE